VVNALADGFSYAYAPSIILKDGTYHMFFCSMGWLDYPSWDSIRYTTSTDGQNWSLPQVKLQATAANGRDMAACDPSVVFYEGFYYLFYSSAVTTGPQLFQTVIQVARSVDIAGPYLTYTQRGTWEDTPSDPQVIIYPLQTHCTNPSGYGAGQQTVVVQNGKLMM
jgi:beta-xylosidase